MSVKVGDKVKILREIWEEATGDYPGGVLAEQGDVVTINKIDGDSQPNRPYVVAHEWYGRKGGFRVSADEIEVIE